MSFEWPQLFWLLFVPVLLMGWEISHRRRVAATGRPKILRAEAGVRSLKLSAFEANAPAHQTRPRWWLFLGLVLTVVALTRPQWGRIDEPVFDQSREILLAVDLSRSMLAQDVRPSRLDRSKLLIQSLLEKLAGERVGLVVFAGTAFLQSPLSADYEILREFLPALGPEFLPEGGTNYRALIDTSLGAFAGGPTADRFLIILSDGEATEDNWKDRAEELKTKGIRVIGLGVGTTTGGMIPDSAGGLVKDERGAVIMTKLEPATLQELARVTNGVYRDASTWVDLAALLKETVESGLKGKFVEKNTVRLVERFQWPLAFGLWCLLVSFCYEFPVRPRVRELKLMPVSGRRMTEDGGRTPEGAGRTAEKPVVTTVASLILVLVAVLCSPSSGLAAAVVAPSKNDPTPKEPPAGTALAKIVGRLSAAPNTSARDWAEFGRETVMWGSHLETEGKEIPEGPVRDALKAVDIGSKLDPKTTDWPKLREELEALLKKHDEEQPPEDKKDKKEQKQDQEKKDQDQSPDKSQSDDAKSNEDQKKPPEDQNKTPPDQKPQGESAFGDMKQQNESPPPPPPDTQKVGGAQEMSSEAKEPVDPALALPLQKLDQLRNQDSPALLFQLMEGDKKPVKKSGKDY